MIAGIITGLTTGAAFLTALAALLHSIETRKRIR